VDARESFGLLNRGSHAVSGELDDVSLVGRAQAGDEAAFTLLVNQRQNQLYRMAWSILRNDADALDAAQDTCIKAWRELPRLRDPDRFDAWLMRSLVNRCRDALRARNRSAVREIRIGDEEHAAGGASSGGLSDDLATADAIRRAFERLSPDDRTYIALHYAENRSISEIAALVRAPEGTVKWRLSRARQALERQLARQQR
jgi:RNA polymerase sigma-70 factor (ECF subfamily)